MKTLMFFAIAFISLTICSQSSENYFITKDGKKINVYKNSSGANYKERRHYFSGDYELTGLSFFYHNKEGKLQRTQQAKIQEAFLFGKHFVNLKIGSMFGITRLHEVIAENENYMVTQYYDLGYFCYLYDKKMRNYLSKEKR